MVARYGHLTEYDSWNSQSYYQTRLGLFGYPQPEFVIQEMQRQIADPSFPVFRFFLDDLAEAQFLAAYPQPVGPYMADDPVREKERRDLIDQRLKALTDLTEQDRQELAASVHTKSGRARAASLYALFVSNYARRDMPAHRKLARALVPVFDDLTPEEQSDLLGDWNWTLLRGPDMLPVLRRLYAVPLPVIDSGSAQDDEAKQRHSLALRRLMELSPAEGRALLLAEIKNADTKIGLPTLCSLPDRRLPTLDTILAANLESSLKHGQGDSAIESRLVERYATSAILLRVKAVYGDNGCDVQANLLAYFLRTDHAYGLKQMKAALASRKATGCYRSVLSDVAALAAGPDVERLAVSSLHDPDTEVAADAAKTLGAYGSRAAEAPLWARMREWHKQWAGKAAQIEPTGNPVSNAWELEYALTQALATAPGWLLDKTQLQTLNSLCVTLGGHQNMAALVQDWTMPVGISYDGDLWRVAQYISLPSLGSLENKLAQFPHGTQFRLFSAGFPPGMQQAQVLGRLKPFLEKRGMHIEADPFSPR